MTSPRSPLEPDRVDSRASEPDNPRLDAWLRRTETPLDVLALCTIWLTVVPLGHIKDIGGEPMLWIIARVGLSLIYGIDMAVRTRLSHRPRHYLIHHPVGVLAVVLPVLRLLFSVRLLRAMFRKGNLVHFLLVAALVFLNFTLIVYGFEVNAANANITTIGLSLWWAFVTVATVGYGDYYPITVGGRIFAVLLMGLGLITIAVVTAQIASSFMDQAAARRAVLAAAKAGPNAPSVPDAVPNVVSTAMVDDSVDGPDTVQARLIRIEQLLLHGRDGPQT
jgi:voltage-gated potassium channel